VPEALGKGTKTLGKAFAECNTRQRASVESFNGKASFAECQTWRTRQRFCRVPMALGKVLTPSAILFILTFFYLFSLPSATLGKEFLFFLKKNSLPSAGPQALGKEKIEKTKK
jgi:hypothetical protein